MSTRSSYTSARSSIPGHNPSLGHNHNSPINSVHSRLPQPIHRSFSSVSNASSHTGVIDWLDTQANASHHHQGGHITTSGSSSNQSTVRPNDISIQSHNTTNPSQTHINPSPQSVSTNGGGRAGNISALFQRMAGSTMSQHPIDPNAAPRRNFSLFQGRRTTQRPPLPPGHAGSATPPPPHVVAAAVETPGLMVGVLVPYRAPSSEQHTNEAAVHGASDNAVQPSTGSKNEWWRWKAPELVQKDSRFSFKKWRRGEGEPPMEFQHKNLDYAAALGNEIFIGAPVKALAHTVMSVSEPISKAVHATGQVGSSVGGAVGETVGGLLYGADEIVQAGKQVGQDLEPSSFSTRLGGGGGVGRQ